MNTPPPNAALMNLVSSLGEDDTRDLVRMFLKEFPSMLGRLPSLPREEAQRTVHGMKSSAHHMGAEALSRRLAALEDRLGQADAAVTHQDLADLSVDFDRAAPPLSVFARN
jgi:HPt (histidine-containing phosphotransfer) domain-containing protein